jgi:outer membrane protein with beta-barrel domain
MKIRCGTFFPCAVVALMTIAAPAFAQQSTTTTKTTVGDDHAGFGIGVEGGISVNKVSTDVSTNFDTRTGSMFGLWLGGSKGSVVSFTEEFLYVIRKLGPSSTEVTQHAVELPSLFRINFGARSTNGVAGYAVVGPVFTINVKTDVPAGLSADNFQSADIGVMAGGGIEAYRVGVEVRGNWGQKSITTSGTNVGQFVDAKNRSIELLVKFRFN